MTRRKSVVLLMVLMLAVLLTSPWASAPKPERMPERSFTDAEDPAAEPAIVEQASLNITIISDEPAFDRLQRQSELFSDLHPDMNVELTRLDPDAAPDWLENWRQRAEDVDAALVPSAWVKRLAVAGELRTVDAAFEGDALSQQFEGIKAQVKWNGYMWGVPHHLDPYVIVWNRARLSTVVRADGSALALPLANDDWAALGAGLAQQNARQWLALDERDPGALLAWLSAAAGLRPERLLAGDAGDLGAGRAAQLLETLGASEGALRRPDGDIAFWRALAGGEYVAAVMTESAAASGIAQLTRTEAAALSIDRSGWDKPYAFDGGSSFVVGARSRSAEAARTWIAGMTTQELQADNYDTLGYLPPARAVYDSHPQMPALASQNRQQFPNWEPDAAPDWTQRLDKLGTLWSEWRLGALALGEWSARWSGLLAELQLHD